MSANSTYKRRKANHECTYCGAKLPDDYKFFVVYFRFKQAHDMPGEVVNIMNKIVQSRSFQDYM